MGKITAKYSIKTTTIGLAYASSLKSANAIKKEFGGTISKIRKAKRI